MSELLVNTIKKADGTGSLTVPAESGTVVTTASPSLGRRNLIINGAMQVAQRGTSTTGITSGASYSASDRWNFSVGSAGTWTASQSTDAPDGFFNSFKLECTTSSSLSSGSLVVLQQAIEGQDLQQLKKGTANAEPITVSFWVKSAKTGTHIFEIYDVDNARQVSNAYTINTADTWEHKTITIDGDTAGSLDNDNNASLWFVFWLAAGTDFTSGTLSDSWTANTNANRVVGQVNLADTNGNDWYVTGVQLEVGTVATPFEHRSYGEELALCQRYFWRTTGDNYHAFGSGHVNDATAPRAFIPNPVYMRAKPTLSISGSMRGNAGGSNSDVTAINASWSGIPSNMVAFTTTSLTVGHGFIIHHQNNTSNYFQADAEL